VKASFNDKCTDKGSDLIGASLGLPIWATQKSEPKDLLFDAYGL
jgi:hypothetical protein